MLCRGHSGVDVVLDTLRRVGNFVCAHLSLGAKRPVVLCCRQAACRCAEECGPCVAAANGNVLVTYKTQVFSTSLVTDARCALCDALNLVLLRESRTRLCLRAASLERGRGGASELAGGEGASEAKDNCSIGFHPPALATKCQLSPEYRFFCVSGWAGQLLGVGVGRPPPAPRQSPAHLLSRHGISPRQLPSKPLVRDWHHHFRSVLPAQVVARNVRSASGGAGMRHDPSIMVSGVQVQIASRLGNRGHHSFSRLVSLPCVTLRLHGHF